MTANTMRAAVYHGARDIRIEQVPTPARGAQDVLVRVLRSGLCGTDVTEWLSGPVMIPLTKEHPYSQHRGPMIPGHEIVGEIVEAPEDSGLQPGTTAVSGAQVACGECKNCLAGRINVCERLYTLGLQTNGGHAEFVVGPAPYWIATPEGLDIDAAGLAQPLGVGLHAARRAGVVTGDAVLVTGAGAIGTFILAALHHLHPAVHITVADIDQLKLARAVRLGADATINLGDGETPSEKAYDVVIEAAGAPGLLVECLRYTRTGGRLLAVGMSATPQLLDPHDLVMREITMEGTNALITPEDIPAALEILNAGTLATEMLDSVRPLSAIAETLDELASGKIQGKVLLDPSR
jgi:(R,R)-butanediol dehydrogenase/meso-butanediol dehydrogenase/diacetyl reductase